MGFKGTALAIGVLFGTMGISLSAEAARPDRHQSPAANANKAGRHAALPTARTITAKPGKQQFRLSLVGTAHAASRPGFSRASQMHASSSYSYGGISCVPYARQATGMQISGNGWQWWGNAAGSYERGHQPEPGSVMAFRSSGGMRYGHVAVVSQVLGARHVTIDHANWGGPGIRRGSVMQDVHVIDVSSANDWTDVRVQVGHDRDSFGRSYATYGFIYNRPDSGRWLAQGETRPVLEEVAEAPDPAAAPRVGQRSSNRRTARR